MKRLGVSYTRANVRIEDFENEIWQTTESANLNFYWSGVSAETERSARARVLWNETALFAQFEAQQLEPLIVNNKPNRRKKAIGLWERDVFEIFVAPDAEKTRNYFEFEVAPTGEWLDARIEILPNGERYTDFEYVSGMKTAALITKNKIFAAIEINWEAFARKPKEGDKWRGNLFRCVGSGATRGYLAWQPTETESPNFHVPEKFGIFEFTKN